jgi:hypothetical protein
MTNDTIKLTRKGLHKYFHVSKRDTYISGTLSLLFLILVLFKVFNRLFEWDISTSYISWQDALQLTILWGIFGIVSDMYYKKHEAKYDN